MVERYSRPEMKRIWSEENKFRKWLEVEIAVCEAWSEAGKIPPEAVEEIKRKARVDLGRMQEILKITKHDMTAFLKALSESVGEESRYIHYGLTSSDVMDTALAMQLCEAADLLLQDLDELLKVLEEKALEHKDTIMIGRTHGVHAEPITFGFKLAQWVEEMRRNKERLLRAKRAVAVGKISGAVGTHATVPPEIEEKALAKLGLEVAPASTQIISRDRHAEFMLALALIAASLEKFATEIRSLQRTEIGEVEEPFKPGQTGSSAMPHKRNPELCERICGLARLIRSYALTALENIPLWHERDISHSSAERVIFPDACLALDYILDLFTYVMRDLKVYPERMEENLRKTKGFIFSQQVLLALVERGMSREEAYYLVQEKAFRAKEEGRDFLEILKEDERIASLIPPEELERLFDPSLCLRHIDATFRRLGLEAEGDGVRSSLPQSQEGGEAPSSRSLPSGGASICSPSPN